MLGVCLRRLVPLQHVVEPRAVLAPDWSIGRSVGQLVGRSVDRMVGRSLWYAVVGQFEHHTTRRWATIPAGGIRRRKKGSQISNVIVRVLPSPKHRCTGSGKMLSKTYALGACRPGTSPEYDQDNQVYSVHPRGVSQSFLLFFVFISFNDLRPSSAFSPPTAVLTPICTTERAHSRKQKRNHSFFSFDKTPGRFRPGDGILYREYLA